MRGTGCTEPFISYVMPVNVECSLILLSLLDSTTPVITPALSSCFFTATLFPDNRYKEWYNIKLTPRGMQGRLIMNDLTHYADNIQVREDGHWCSALGNRGSEYKSHRTDLSLFFFWLGVLSGGQTGLQTWGRLNCQLWFMNDVIMAF